MMGFFYFFLSIKLLFAQDILQNPASLDGQKLREKIFVHLDREFYMRGEIMWFKLWAFNGSNNKIMDLSKIAYIELIDHTNKPVAQMKIALKDGKGDGSLQIPEGITSGNYNFRAYTAYMKNFPAEYFYKQEITIINTEKREVSTNVKRMQYVANLFPEGGSLVHGIKSTMGFKASDLSGRSVTFKGFILDTKGDTIKKFLPHKFGMGHFDFTPSVDEKYKAVWIFSDSTILFTDLPPVSLEGYGLSLLDVEGEDLSLRVYSSHKVVEYDTLDKSNGEQNVEDEEILLVCHNNEKTVFAEKKILAGGKCKYRLNRSKLPEGICWFTIFNELGQPVCERKYFTIPKDTLLGSIKINEKPQLRSSVSLQLNLTNIATDTNETLNLSVAIFLQDSLQGVPKCSIANYLYLTSEINGYIESPAYYFQSTVESNEALHNLLITQGWTSYRDDSKKMNSKTSAPFLPEIEGPYLQASVYDKNTGLPVSGKLVYVTIPKSDNYFYCGKSNSGGSLILPMLNFEGTREAIIQLDNKETNATIKVKNEFSNAFYSGVLKPIDVVSLPKADLETRLVNANVLNTFNFAGTTDTIKESRRPQFYGLPSKSYLLDDFTRFPTMEEVLKEYVMEVALRKKNGKFVCYVTNENGVGLFPEEPLYLLDGLPIFDAEKLIRYDPKKVKKIEVITKRYLLGPLITNGIVSLFTYNSDLPDFKLDSSAIVIDYKGLEKRRKFYSPNYDQETNATIPDFRNLLYWNPDIDLNGSKLKVDFSISSQAGNYVVVINGISNLGRTLSITKTFSVGLKEGN